MPKLPPAPAEIAADTSQRALASGKEPLPPVDQAPDDPPDRNTGPDLGFVSLEDQTDYLNVIYYGRDATGKTTDAAAMANLPQPGRLLLVNAEGGAKVSALRRRGIDVSRIAVWPDPKKGQVLNYPALDALYWKVKNDLAEDPDSWLGTCWDSLTEITARVLESVVVAEVEKARRANKTRDRWFTDRGDYRVMSDQLSNLLRRFRDLPCHFAVTALEELRETERADGSKSPMWGPMLTPAMSAAIMGYVDIAIRCQSGPVLGPDGPVDEYIGTTKPELDVRAKDRFGILPRAMPNPTFDRVAGYVREEITEAIDPQIAESTELHQHAAAAEQATAEAKKTRASSARAANSARKV